MSELNFTRKPCGYWTVARIKEEAGKYRCLGDMAEMSRGAYKAALREGVVGDLFEPTRRTWDEDAIRKEASKYSGWRGLHRGCQPAYNAAKRLNLTDIFDSRYASWSCETAIREEGKKYTGKRAFAKGSSGASAAAIRLGILDSMFENNRRYTDADVVYIWCVDNVLVKDMLLVKVGVTSKRLGDSRVRICAAKNGFAVSRLRIFECAWGKRVESQVLETLTDKPDIGIRDGKREFRLVARSEYEGLVEYISALTKQP